MGNAADCKYCNNRGTFYGCRKCKRVTPEGKEQKKKDYERFS